MDRSWLEDHQSGMVEDQIAHRLVRAGVVVSEFLLGSRSARLTVDSVTRRSPEAVCSQNLQPVSSSKRFTYSW